MAVTGVFETALGVRGLPWAVFGSVCLAGWQRCGCANRGPSRDLILGLGRLQDLVAARVASWFRPSFGVHQGFGRPRMGKAFLGQPQGPAGGAVLDGCADSFMSRSRSSPRGVPNLRHACIGRGRSRISRRRGSRISKSAQALGTPCGRRDVLVVLVRWRRELGKGMVPLRATSLIRHVGSFQCKRRDETFGVPPRAGHPVVLIRSPIAVAGGPVESSIGASTGKVGELGRITPSMPRVPNSDRIGDGGRVWSSYGGRTPSLGEDPADIRGQERRHAADRGRPPCCRFRGVLEG